MTSTIARGSTCRHEGQQQRGGHFSQLHMTAAQPKERHKVHATATGGNVSSSSASNDIPVAGLEIRVGRIGNVTEHEKEKHEKEKIVKREPSDIKNKLKRQEIVVRKR